MDVIGAGVVAVFAWVVAEFDADDVEITRVLVVIDGLVPDVTALLPHPKLPTPNTRVETITSGKKQVFTLKY
jgi:hypothetical protein